MAVFLVPALLLALSGPSTSLRSAQDDTVAVRSAQDDTVAVRSAQDDTVAVRSAQDDMGSAQMLYMMHCSSCHGDNGQGSNVAPALIGKTAADIHLMLDTGRMPASVPYINEIHKEPAFTEAQISQIVTYVQSFTPGNANSDLPKIMPGDVAHGRALFDENCAHCHGAAGNGASVGYDNVAPSLMNASVFQVAEAIRSGPEIMPRFGRDVLSDQDVSDIARYVNYLQTQSSAPASIDAGGIALGHVGPVAEGLIAWIFGIGLLMLFIRGIGTSTT